MTVQIQFFTQHEDKSSNELFTVETEYVPRVGELVVFREVEDGEDVFGDYVVIDVAYRYFISEKEGYQPEFVVVTLKPYVPEGSDTD